MLNICSSAHTFALPIQLQLSQQPTHAKDLLHIHILSAIQMQLNQPTAHDKDMLLIFSHHMLLIINNVYHLCWSYNTAQVYPRHYYSH